MPITLPEYIAILQKILAEHGPLPVEKWMPSKGRHPAPAPIVAHRRRYGTRRAGEAQVPAFYHPEHDTQAQKGEAVVRI